ncbi:TetR/AcrR family transcriptional regulator [Kineococcus sp. SYSU DK001]|uniref:TetR/AcrR family transcriptional regulator n=1 Tax=Kineococcus sp. SYSU DK001 TaxID=3383122 RepID=UPI003D7CAFD8
MTPTLRTDAQENRQRILAVAAEALTQDGTVSLNAIAKRAGVGPGTLYRHFPDRESLVMAVYRHDVAALVASAADLLQQQPPAAALRDWCLRLGRFGLLKHGLSDVLRTSTGRRLHGESYEPVVQALGLLMSAAERAGAVRSGVAPADLLLLLGFLWRLDPDDDWEQRAGELLTVVLDGLSPG